jgi:hexosaminidase
MSPLAVARATTLLLFPLIASRVVFGQDSATPHSARAVAAATDNDYALIPAPRELEKRAPLSLARGVSVSAGMNPEDRFTAADLTQALASRGVSVRVGAPVRVSLVRRNLCPPASNPNNPPPRCVSALAEEGYRLTTSPGLIEIAAQSAAGLFYGAQTLKQLTGGYGASAHVQGARITDWPAMRWRGMQDDLSRGPVPTLEYQKKQIRRFAELKINLYSPFYEQSLAYAAHPLIAPPGGAMSRDDVRELVTYARKYHIEIAPEQEAFGHLHHVLKLEKYSALAETEHGHVLAPGDSMSLPLIRSWFAEIDTMFPGRFVHIGADETFELGRGRTAQGVRDQGIGRVYLDFVSRVARDIQRPGKQLLFWGDMAQNHPDLVASLPKGMIAVAWNYGSQKDFANQILPFKNAGMETWVAPGVSSWNRIYPNFGTALANIQVFVRDGQRLGSTGVLNTSWDDDGEAIFGQVWYGVAYGAAASWQEGEADIGAFQRAYGRAVQGDTSGGLNAAERELIQAHAVLERVGLGEADTYLFWLDPWSEEGRDVTKKILPVVRELRLHAEEAILAVTRARAQEHLPDRDALDAVELGARRIDALGLKFQMAEETARAYANAYDNSTGNPSAVGRELGAITSANGRLEDLRDLFGLTRELWEQAWRRENRPYWLANTLARYDASMQLWIGRIDKVKNAWRGWERTKRIPSPQEIGIPHPVELPATTTIP